MIEIIQIFISGVYMMMKRDAVKGHKVVYKNPMCGRPFDQKVARKHLKVGQEYTVSRTETQSWSQNVHLEEVPGVAFSITLFEDVRS